MIRAIGDGPQALSGEEVHPVLSDMSPTPADIAKMADLRTHFAGPSEIVEDLQVYPV